MNKFNPIQWFTNPSPVPSSFNNGFSQYETINALLDLVNNLINNGNLGADEIEELKERKIDIESYKADLIKRKLSENGDFTGTWNGVEMHTSEEGLASDWNASKGTFGTVSERLNTSDTQISNIDKKVDDNKTETDNKIKSNSDELIAQSNTINSIPRVYRNKSLSSNNDVLLNPENSISPSELNFDLVGVKTSQNKKIPIFFDDFTREINQSGSELYLPIKNNGATVNFTSSDWALRFPNNGSEDEMILKTSINVLTSNIDMSIKVQYLDDLSSPRIGFCKDINNWLMFNVDEIYNSCEIIYKKDGIFGKATGTYFDIKSMLPCKLHFHMLNNVVLAYIEEINTGKCMKVLEWNVGNIFDFTDKNVLTSYSPSIGARVGQNNNLILKDFEVNYTSGMSMGADYKVITYENGNPVRHNDLIYFTSTTHSTSDISGGGVNIYSLNVNSFNVELVGKLGCIINSKVVNLGSVKILYDRNIGRFIFVGTNFMEYPCKCYIGTTEHNLLCGVNVIDCYKMGISGNDNGTWDIDLIYDESVSKYRAIYSMDGSPRKIYLCECDTPLGTYSEIKNVNTSSSGEGSVFTHIGGKQYFTHVSNSFNLDIWDYPNLSKVDTIKCNIWSGNANTPITPMPWGSIVPIQSGNHTTYMMLVFSMRRWEGREYSYGDLWVYKSREMQEGQEFKNEDLIFF